MLVCTVRDCQMPLSRTERRLVCPRGHSFDIARSGYINLLQPQDRRSRDPGDTSAAVVGRRRVYDMGVAEPILHAIRNFAAIEGADVLLDAGCGDGYYLGSLQKLVGCDAHGVDISAPAIEAAARRYPECEWVIANADRIVPYADNTFSAVLSITARMNASEFRRVLGEDGRLLVAVPAPDDLIELRGSGRDRVERTVEMFSPHFTLSKKERATTAAELEADLVQGLLHSVYRPLRREVPGAMRVTFSLDLLLFVPA